MAKRLLIVEDDAASAALLRTVFQDMGHEVQMAGDLAAAQRSLHLCPRPDMVVLDVLLPDGSGLDLCTELKTAWPDLPVLVISGLGHMVRPEALAAGADDTMAKPFELEELEATAARLLAPPRPGRPAAPCGAADEGMSAPTASTTPVPPAASPR